MAYLCAYNYHSSPNLSWKSIPEPHKNKCCWIRNSGLNGVRVNGRLPGTKDASARKSRVSAVALSLKSTTPLLRGQTETRLERVAKLRLLSGVFI
ncbi:hypothetical protein CEXT_495531 [Caerostris extrusa]|uniref:Uncharacterized protein n=1 Tax=Caerostris extrusa TaxID=172846 RepID=A0AAV4Q219_CAEEX|nr:hypothetical protein CEXT_495531 [Caerostris extrusa]